MQLSFVIPAHDEEAHITACVEAIHHACQGLSQDYEVLVVADACQDHTPLLAIQAGAGLLQVDHRHIAATRNAGARHSQGEWIFFVDADTRVTPAAVAAALGQLRKGAAGGGGLFRFDRPVPFYGRVIEPLFWVFCLVTQMSGGCFLYCTRSAFEQVGGFDSRLYAGEELAFAAAIKKRGRFRVVPYAVLTSARKIRLYSGRELLRIIWQLASKGPQALSDRSGLELWYQRRPEK